MNPTHKPRKVLKVHERSYQKMMKNTKLGEKVETKAKINISNEEDSKAFFLP
jgi:hypothetical protein